MSRQPRSDQDYVNESLMHGLMVLEALEGSNFEPVTIQRIVDRTKLPYDKVRRCLMTLKHKQWAVQNEVGWQVGTRLLRFSERFNELCLATIQDSAISES